MSTLAFDPNAEFTAMLKGDSDIDLIHAALCIAGQYDPTLDPSDSYRRLAKLSNRAHAEIDTNQNLKEIAAKFCHFLCHQIGFSGDNKDYYNPDNSYLNRVLETRRGIPISLALVYIGVGDALGLCIKGVGFPGHFLLKLCPERNTNNVEKSQYCFEEEGVIIDPFTGQLLNFEDCKDLLKISSGNTLAFKPGYLQTISKRAILRRMLGNLKAIYMRKADYIHALSLCDRLLLLDENAIQERLDRSVILEKLDCHESAAKDLEQILRTNSTIQGIPTLQRKITELRANVGGKPH